MASSLVFIYDGECPFCNHFAELLELKSNLPNLAIKNARENPSELPNWYDMDTKGALLLKDGEILQGANAIHWICSHTKEPSDGLLKIISLVFSSSRNAGFLFPFLLMARRVLLFLKGVPQKIIF